MGLPRARRLDLGTGGAFVPALPCLQDIWYFRRDFCPRCGTSEPETLEASGRGIVYAATTVNRAPSAALRALAPYRILIVDAQEGFRLMAHGELDLSIGDAVAARFQKFGLLLIPHFERQEPAP